MKATVDFVQRKFAEFNRLIFGGALPELPILLTGDIGALGKCCYVERRMPDGRKEYGDFSLRISGRFDLPESVLEDVIIHEMIHYFILRHNLNDTSAHGAIFKAVMQRVNVVHGRRVGISHRLTAEERVKAVSGGSGERWYVVAMIVFRSGEVGVKVLPRRESRVVEFCARVGVSVEVMRIELFLHNNPFFSRYPRSSALRVHAVDLGLLTEQLAGARRLAVRGDRVVDLGMECE